MKKSRDTRVKEMLDEISTAYSDEDVKQRQDLRDMLLKSAADLEKNQDVELESTKLCKKIALVYLANKENFPKALVLLHNQLKNDATKYDSVVAAAFLLPIWF
ncbi:bacteriocin immunity protein [Companilactobacillus mishanensis]|uniref:Bacteriocin immunity protein n=1 Tax=Companilactobacillus mishanensis TaxID=2486008 RepID=A0ABW9P627_9LACO|nr:bacteriocin immunity protein [Companilactobacillus mishanensis]MQS44622.1 bacteriocin immunity protein [Companilactobacillus mishanensis]